MIGLLVVPVGVLLLVVVLALIGGRWTVPGSYGEREPLEDYDEPFVDPWSADPWRLAEPPPPARLAYGVLSHERYDRPPEPDPESSQQQGFPYGPDRYQ
jgi:hypothetical protein